MIGLAMGLLMTATGTSTAALPAGTTVAQEHAALDAPAVVAEVRRLIAAHYVLPDMREKLDRVLAKSLAEGRYGVSDADELVRRLNADFAATAHDKHLSIHISPGEAAMLHGGQGDRQTAGPGFERMAQVRNHGLREMRVLEGNIRYLAVDGFAWTGPKSAEAYDNAIRFLRDGDAVVLDLRANGGGSPEAVRYLVSHFVEAGKPLVTFYEGREKPDVWTSLGDLPAGRLTGKPLYVLTSARTASAAEEFAGHVAGYRLGELIGATTAGAGFRNETYPIAGQFVLSVSVARAVLASTGSDWEGKGIAPTVAVDPEKALDVAQMRAARALAATARSDYEKRAYAGLAAMLAARVEPHATALPLQAYAGRFGEGNVVLKDGRLQVDGGDGASRRLLPLGGNLFAVDGDSRVKVEFVVADGTPVELDILFPDGRRMKKPRAAQP